MGHRLLIKAVLVASLLVILTIVSSPSEIPVFPAAEREESDDFKRNLLHAGIRIHSEERRRRLHETAQDRNRRRIQL
ncbi:hypothetical protein SAY86_029533 [Trapa natans]|uniref:Uncharacterized protein n=1 Tax=Trapa natans TaxID=22666 RepID=A0AAN7RC05_TRANT|nr:hypothetical protein SAY86_029533 [Trapa natans]